MGKLRPQSGFSLIELVVTVSIVAVVMAMLVPGIRQATDAFQLRKAASLAVAELRTAQALATANGVDVIFEFFTTSGTPGSSGGVRYWAGGGELRHVLPPEWPAIIQWRDGSGLPACTAPADTSHLCLTFKPLGYADNTGAVGTPTLKLRTRAAGAEYTVTVELATSKVRVTQ